MAKRTLGTIFEAAGAEQVLAIDRDTPMLRHAAQDGHDIGGLLDLLRLEHHD